MHRIAYYMRFKPSYQTTLLYASIRVPRRAPFSGAAAGNFKEDLMQKVVVITGAVIMRFVLTSATALAQNIQGPAAPNFGVSSAPWTGGIPNDDIRRSNPTCYGGCDATGLAGALSASTTNGGH